MTHFATIRSLLLATLAASTACTTTSLDDDLDVGETSSELYDPSNPPTPVATDACDDPTFAGVSYASTSSAHFTAYYLPGTAAETDVADILAAREAAYDDISAKLALSNAPTISVYLSPNRLAAGAHSRSTGNAFPGSDRYEVVYTGDAESFEKMRPGNLLARVLEYHLDTANRKRISLFSTGMAEYLDQSGRNLHDAYAQQLLAGVETRVRINTFDSADLTGKNIGRAGSLTKFLIDRYGMAGFRDIWKATAVTSVSGCSQSSATYGCINSTTALTTMLNGILNAQQGEGWSTVAAAWKAEVDSHLATASTATSQADQRAIKNLVNLMDEGIVTKDPAVYRSTMEGFYCEWGGDSMRSDIAARTTESFGTAASYVIRIYPVAMANYPAARVLIRRLDERNMVSVQALTVEKFPVGWRVTYGADWW